MQIFIQSSSEGNIPEWSAIELQGDLRSDQRAALQGATIGDLHYTKQGEPLLVIGHHVLSGKVTKFEKPLALMDKVQNGNEIEYQVRGIIRRKILFSERPRPIVASVEQDPAIERLI